jgi:hypothetical protein
VLARIRLQFSLTVMGVTFGSCLRAQRCFDRSNVGALSWPMFVVLRRLRVIAVRYPRSTSDNFRSTSERLLRGARRYSVWAFEEARYAASLCGVDRGFR